MPEKHKHVYFSAYFLHLNNKKSFEVIIYNQALSLILSNSVCFVLLCVCFIKFVIKKVLITTTTFNNWCQSKIFFYNVRNLYRVFTYYNLLFFIRKIFLLLECLLKKTTPKVLKLTNTEFERNREARNN